MHLRRLLVVLAASVLTPHLFGPTAVGEPQPAARPLSICDLQESIARLRKDGSKAYRTAIQVEAVFLWVPPHGYTLKDSRCPSVALDPVFVAGDPSVAEFERAYPTFHPSYATDPDLWGPGSAFVVALSGAFEWSAREIPSGMVRVNRVESFKRISVTVFSKELDEARLAAARRER
jgi:hypothetical protein